MFEKILNTLVVIIMVLVSYALVLTILFTQREFVNYEGNYEDGKEEILDQLFEYFNEQGENTDNISFTVSTGSGKAATAYCYSEPKSEKSKPISEGGFTALMIAENTAFDYGFENVYEPTIFVQSAEDSKIDEWVGIRKADDDKIQFFTENFSVIAWDREELINSINDL